MRDELEAAGLDVRPLSSASELSSTTPPDTLVILESDDPAELTAVLRLADQARVSIPLIQITPVQSRPQPSDPRVLCLPPTVLAPPSGVHLLEGWTQWAAWPGSSQMPFLCDHLPVAMARLTRDGRIAAANLALRRLLGEPDPQSLGDCIHPADRSRAIDVWRRIEQGEGIVHFAARCRHRNGSWRNLSWSATRAPGEPAVIMVGRDITPAIEAEERIRQLEAAVDAAALGIVITDVQGRIQWANAAFSSMTGYSREEVIGQYPRLLKSGRHPPEFYTQMWATILRGEVWRGTLVNRRKDGSLYTERMTITPLRRADGSIERFIAIKEDVTESEALQEQAAHVARMESVSRLAGGIAHDFNNLLQTILGYAEFIAARFPEGDPGRADVETIRAAARQGADLTRRLLAFSRRQIIEPRPIDLNELLRGLVALIRRVIGEQIEVVLQLDESLSPVMADPGQVETVVMNLASNARDVMPHGGRITIATRAVSFRPDDVAIFTDARPGTFACISVSDTGPGIPDEVRRHIFEPFFSAKGWGRGTGLGLATVYGIVRQHGGWIHVYSEPGQGTCFRIYLPTAGAQPVPEVLPPSLTDKPRHILVVEDEISIAQLASRILAAAGYGVSVAHNAAAARALFALKGPTIDLVFSDVLLPDGNGVDLVDELRRRRPDLAVILVSGYPDDFSRWEQIRERGWPFIQKPYPSTELLAEVARALSPQSTPPDFDAPTAPRPVNKTDDPDH